MDITHQAAPGDTTTEKPVHILLGPTLLAFVPFPHLPGLWRLVHGACRPGPFPHPPTIPARIIPYNVEYDGVGSCTTRAECRQASEASRDSREHVRAVQGVGRPHLFRSTNGNGLDGTDLHPTRKPHLVKRKEEKSTGHISRMSPTRQANSLTTTSDHHYSSKGQPTRPGRSR